MAASEGVSTGEGNDLLVIHTHLVEDIAKVCGALAGVGQAAIGHAATAVGGVGATGTPLDLRAAHLLHSNHTSEGPEVGVCDARVLFLDGLEQVAGHVQAGIGAPLGLGGEAHGGAVGAARAILDVVGAGRVPGQADEEGTE